MNYVFRNDAHYRKISAHGENIIIGLSRASRGIVPAVLDSILSQYVNGEFKNLAISNNISPYGDPYNDFIYRQVSNQK